jgi:predicted RNA binding protein YcfA (HicA-like mRNA interferase family)
VPRFGPTKREQLIKYLRTLGFDGPHSGSRHQFMKKGQVRLWIPNPHRGEIGKEFLLKILKQADIDRQTWEKL